MATEIATQEKFEDNDVIITQKSEQDKIIDTTGHDERILSLVENNGENQNSCDNHSSERTEDTTEVFNAIQPVNLLKDKRRTRIKSTGRPPSQLFLKEIILQNYFSMDNDDIQNEDITDSKLSEIRHLINKSQPEPKLITVVNAMSAVTAEIISTSNWNKIPLKKIPKPPNEKSEDSRPPWMKEVLARKHKVSLKGDEFMNLTTKHERHTVLNIIASDTTKSEVVEETVFVQNKITKVEVPVPLANEQIRSIESPCNDVKSMPDELPNNANPINSDKSTDVTVENLTPSVTTEEQPTNEIAKKRVDDVNVKSAMSLLEDVEIFLIKSKTKQENMLQQIKELQLSVQNCFEEDIVAIEHLKKNVTQIMDGK